MEHVNSQQFIIQSPGPGPGCSYVITPSVLGSRLEVTIEDGGSYHYGLCHEVFVSYPTGVLKSTIRAVFLDIFAKADLRL